MEISESLKRFRKRFKLTQDEVAKVLGTTKQGYYPYEKGRSMSAESVKKIAVYFNVSTDYLLGLTDKPNSDINQEFVNGIEYLYRLVNNRVPSQPPSE